MFQERVSRASHTLRTSAAPAQKTQNAQNTAISRTGAAWALENAARAGLLVRTRLLQRIRCTEQSYAEYSARRLYTHSFNVSVRACATEYSACALKFENLKIENLKI